MTSKYYSFLATLTLTLGFSIVSTTSASDKGMERKANRILNTLEEIQFDELSRIPAEVIKQARGIIILRQYEAGFILGGKGGYGMALQRNNKNHWGPPAWIKTGEGSGGLQIGIQKLNVALLLMTDDSIEMLSKSKFRVGVDAGATAGPIGANVEAKIGSDVPILVYTDTEGLYAGAAFEGGFLVPNHKSNCDTYGKFLSIPDIISGKEVEIPAIAKSIIKRLKEIEDGE